ncbi:MAG: M23 family metallopeptidase [Corynebacterium sp.]|nr:M23 family metallopeptidase [Corynebacterium sp.]
MRLSTDSSVPALLSDATATFTCHGYSMRLQIRKSLTVLGLFITLPVLVGWVDPSSGLPHATQILRPFDPPTQRWLPGHRGVDLPLTPGSEVYSSGDGLVVFAGNVAGTPVISVQHDGFRTTYQPVHAYVSRGETVKEGQVMGILAHSSDGHAGLHWGAKRGDDDYFNPLLLLRPTIRLKPVDELD